MNISSIFKVFTIGAISVGIMYNINGWLPDLNMVHMGFCMLANPNSSYHCVNNYLNIIRINSLQNDLDELNGRCFDY